MSAKKKTYRLAVAAMLSAVAAVLQFVEFSVPVMPSFVKLDLSDLQSKLLGVVEAVFVVLTVLGVVVDHTTKGLSDSDRAMTYDEPN